MKTVKPTDDEQTTRLDELSKGAEQTASPDSFMNPMKKGRGRPKGSRDKVPRGTASNPMEGTGSIPPEANLDELKQLVRPIWGLVSSVGVKVAETDRAAIGPAEMEVLVYTSARCLNKYLPGILGEHADLILLSITFGNWSLGVYMLRQIRLQELREEYRRTHGEPTRADAPPVQPSIN